MKWKNGVSEVGMNPGFMATLRYAEQGSRIEWTITGAQEDHGQSTAVDIRCHDSSSRFAIVRALIRAGFVRIGVYDNHIHVDRSFDKNKPEYVLWLGISK